MSHLPGQVQSSGRPVRVWFTGMRVKPKRFALTYPGFGLRCDQFDKMSFWQNGQKLKDGVTSEFPKFYTHLFCLHLHASSAERRTWEGASVILRWLRRTLAPAEVRRAAPLSPGRGRSGWRNLAWLPQTWGRSAPSFNPWRTGAGRELSAHFGSGIGCVGGAHLFLGQRARSSRDFSLKSRKPPSSKGDTLRLGNTLRPQHSAQRSQGQEN